MALRVALVSRLNGCEEEGNSSSFDLLNKTSLSFSDSKALKKEEKDRFTLLQQTECLNHVYKIKSDHLPPIKNKKTLKPLIKAKNTISFKSNVYNQGIVHR